MALLIDSFAVCLVMIAVLFVCGAFEDRRSSDPAGDAVVIGLSPFAFLIGLLEARLARSSVGGLLVELHTDPTPAGSARRARPGASRSVAELAYWLPEFGSWAGLDGRARRTAGAGQRQGDDVDRPRRRARGGAAARPGAEDEPELLAAVSAAAGIALENGRLQAEQRARLEELRGSRARVIEAGQKERQRLERNLHDGAQQRLIALSLELSLLEKQLADDPEAATRLDRARREIAVSLDELREPWRAGCTRRYSAGMGWMWRSSRSPRTRLRRCG